MTHRQAFARAVVAICIVLALANALVRDSWAARLVATAALLITAAQVYIAFVRRPKDWEQNDQ